MRRSLSPPLLCLPLLALAAASPAAAAPEAADWNRLRASEATATSYLKSNWNKYVENYHPNYVLDDDPKTAWVEGKEGHGEGEGLTIPLSTLARTSAVKVRIRNGYQKSESLFHANSVPKEVRISALDPAGGVVHAVERTLEKAMGWQEVVLEMPGGRGLSAVRLEVISVYPGKTYKDTCISDVQVLVRSDVRYNAGYEQAKHDRLLAWVKDRVTTAKFFASRPPEYPFAHQQFESRQSDVDAGALARDLAPLRAAMEALKASPTRYRADRARQLAVVPDGVWALQDLLWLLSPDDITLFETDREIVRHRKSGGDDEDPFVNESWESAWRVEWAEGEPRRPARAVFWVRRLSDGRITVDSTTQVLAEYGDGGRLTRVYSTGPTDPELAGWMVGETYEQLVVFEYDAAGKVSGMRRSELGERIDREDPDDPKRIPSATLETFAGH